MKSINLATIALTAFFLTACVSESTTDQTVSSSVTSTQAAANPDPVTPDPVTPDPVTPDPVTPDPVTEETPPAQQPETLPWLRIPLHYEVLLGQPQFWNEAGDILALNLTTTAQAGSTSLMLNSTAELLPLQLISYHGSDGQYYSGQIQSIEGNNILLSTPLKQTVTQGANVWNFYEDGAHANIYGLNAIADYAVSFLGKERLNEGVHVLMGDSWFYDGELFDRLKVNLPQATIFNKGIGGNTSTQMLARFDTDVPQHTPNFVWIMAGTNDYWQGTTAATYKANIKSMVDKIIALGAVPIVFDASVGPLNFGSDEITVLSDSYVTALEQLFSEY